MTQHDPSSPEWLEEHLSILLSSPHISFPTHAGLPGLRMGHGPIDVFSTRFANMFTSDAKGVVGGQEVDKQGLKEALLALQKKWHPDTAKFIAQTPSEQHQSAMMFTWTPRGTDSTAQVKASASVHEEGGTQRINSLTLEGDSALFSK